MFFIFFIFPRNTKFGAAEQKCSAEHRLRNPGLDTYWLDIRLNRFVRFYRSPKRPWVASNIYQWDLLDNPSTQKYSLDSFDSIKSWSDNY